ncbi:MAG: UbiA family prenyltransferase [Bacteroidetes bacterium]|nr:UbiA family prenyltransferase [Bacteroidota bacterium]
MKSILSLIRWPNLVIIAISMIFLMLFVIDPALGINGFSDGMTNLQFILLLVATLLIAIGGYIINDIFDINTDSINKAGKNVVGRSITIKQAYTYYWITTAGGIVAGTLLSYLINQINFGLIFLFSAGLLWFYSQKYQCQPLIGNIVISILSSISIGLVWLFEFYALSSNASVFVNAQTNFPLVNRLVLIYMGYAFMVSFLREMVKDIEDYQGDNRFGCITFTVKFGISASKIVAIFLGYTSLFASAMIQYYFYHAGIVFLFSAFFIIDIIFVIIIYKLHKAVTKSQYSKLALLIKTLMLCGIISMILFYFEF